MRRFADADEVDLRGRRLRCRRVDAAAAAGPGGLEGRRPSTRARSGTRTPTGSATRPARTTCTGPSRGSSPAPIRCRWARTTPAAASAARWCTTPATPRASTPATSRPTPGTGSARTGRSATTTCGPTTRRSRRNCRSPARSGRGATRTPTPTGRTRSAATARSSCAARDKLGITAKVGPVAIANGRFGNRPHCIYRGFCLQGCKVNAKASPLITHIPDALAHGAEVRADAMVTRVEIDERTGRATGVHYVRGGVRPLPAGRGWSRSPATPSRRRGCCSTPPPTGSPTGCATTSTRSAAT